MRQMKRFISLSLALLVLLQCIPFAGAARGEVLTLNGNILDAVTDMEYGWDGLTYRFEEGLLQGIEEGDEVYLVADTLVTGELKAGNEVSVLLSNFRLEGANATDYLLPVIEEDDPIEKLISIYKRRITVEPEHPYAYFGQAISEEINLTLSDAYMEDLVEGDDVQISAGFKAIIGQIVKIGSYPIEITENLTVTGKDADNYEIIMTSDLAFQIQMAEFEQNAYSKDSDTGNFLHIEKTILHAPEGFKISLEPNSLYEAWLDSVEVSLEETNAGVIEYYLRNCNETDSEYFLAISKKQYSYTAVRSITQVTGMEILKAAEETNVQYLQSCVISNGKLFVKVYAQGGPIAQETSLHLLVGDEDRVVTVSANDAVLVDGRYTYCGTFSLDIDAGKFSTTKLYAYATNAIGTGSVYPLPTSTDHFIGLETSVQAPITLDKELPQAKVSNINGNAYQNYTFGISAKFTVSDLGSGIAKIEYLWDDSFKLSKADQEWQTDYVELKDISSDKTDYELFLPWSCSQTIPDDRHTLKLRVTDKAGNVTMISHLDKIGSDSNYPTIESVEIRPVERNTTDELIYFLTFGTFSGKSVEVAVKANDYNANAWFSSGIDSVFINGIKAEYNSSTNEYVVTLSADTEIEALSIAVTDNVGHTTNALVTEIPNRGAIAANALIIEDDAPVIVFGKTLENASTDPSGKAWFGADDLDAEIHITVSDSSGDVRSGLRVVKILCHESEWSEEIDGDNRVNPVEKTILVSGLEDGKTVCNVQATDYCGNITESSVVFYKDTVAPSEAKVSFLSEGVLIDNNLWFTDEQDVTFRVDVEDDRSGIREVVVTINDQSFRFDHNDILVDGEGSYILLNAKDVNVGEEQCYAISVAVTDFANNTTETSRVTVYIDCENPVISDFSVYKKNDMIDRVLNVLTFGIYSNDSIIFKLSAKESNNDSGISHATIYYEGLSDPVEMIDEGEGVFSYELSTDQDLFQANINVTVYDLCGNTTSSVATITDGTNINNSYNGNYIMLETIIPTITVEMPAADGIERADDQIWFRQNKKISVNVRDVESGIRNIDVTINGMDVTMDIEDVPLLKTDYTESLDSRIDTIQQYSFDTNYLRSVCGHAVDGRYELKVIVTDNAGNTDSFVSCYYIDDEQPVIDYVSFSLDTADGLSGTNQFVEYHEYGFYFKEDFNITLHVSDKSPSSGLYEVQYRFVPYVEGVKQAETTGAVKIVDGKADLSVPKGFNGQIYVEAFDCVLNSTEEKTTKSYIVDDSTPVIDIVKNISTAYRDGEGNPLYAETNSFTVTITDRLAGLRAIGYEQMAEKVSYERVQLNIPNVTHAIGAVLADGWIVTGVDANLVTQIRKTFTFESDDNNVVLVFDAMDNSHNKIYNVRSEKFTVDKTAPVVQIVFREDEDEDLYYNRHRIADVIVTERNFDANLMNAQIQNAFGEIPSFQFTNQSVAEHSAIIDFGEGDYTFGFTGKDCGMHEALVTFAGGNEKLFYVDTTAPILEDNFAEFYNDAEDSFNLDKTAEICITEHNFNSDLMQLKIFRKKAGQDHVEKGLENITHAVLKGNPWKTEGDTHKLSFTFAEEAVYYVEISPVDLAGNSIEKSATAIFEIDKTAPVVYMKNGKATAATNTEALDIYRYDRRNASNPSVMFKDLNISHMEYKLTTYIADYQSTDLAVIRPIVETGTTAGNYYKIPDFSEDGIYVLELFAVDVAGNVSSLNTNTYARMVEQDVLAYILDSDAEEMTGLYSLEYTNGQAISKKPSSFKDLQIFVLTVSNTPANIVLRDSNGKSILVDTRYEIDESLFGVQIWNFEIDNLFFQEHFRNDSDTELQLTVLNENMRIDLATIHIDSVAPLCSIPDTLKSWNWFVGSKERKFCLNNINEKLDVSACKVYDNGQEVDFIYSEDDNTLTFTLGSGWHNVGIILTDVAGNAYNIQEFGNINIGYFWVTVFGLLGLAVLGIGIGLLSRNRKKRTSANEED